jgi:hypothetical protein
MQPAALQLGERPRHPRRLLLRVAGSRLRPPRDRGLSGVQRARRRRGVLDGDEHGVALHEVHGGRTRRRLVVGLYKLNPVDP